MKAQIIINNVIHQYDDLFNFKTIDNQLYRVKIKFHNESWFVLCNIINEFTVIDNVELISVLSNKDIFYLYLNADNKLIRYNVEDVEKIYIDNQLLTLNMN